MSGDYDGQGVHIQAHRRLFRRMTGLLRYSVSSDTSKICAFRAIRHGDQQDKATSAARRQRELREEVLAG